VTPVEESYAEFERLENTLPDYPRPDPRTKFLHDECADVLQRAAEELVPFLTPTQIAQLEHAYWHFMDNTVERMSAEEEDEAANDFCLEDICQELMHFGHDVIRHPEKYPVP